MVAKHPQPQARSLASRTTQRLGELDFAAASSFPMHTTALYTHPYRFPVLLGVFGVISQAAAVRTRLAAVAQPLFVSHNTTPWGIGLAGWRWWTSSPAVRTAESLSRRVAPLFVITNANMVRQHQHGRATSHRGKLDSFLLSPSFH